jgi:hypothetical protein
MQAIRTIIQTALPAIAPRCRSLVDFRTNAFASDLEALVYFFNPGLVWWLSRFLTRPSNTNNNRENYVALCQARRSQNAEPLMCLTHQSFRILHFTAEVPNRRMAH